MSNAHISHSTLPVAIIGGGVTGLSAAWRLQQMGVPYVLLEAGARWGGRIQTDRLHVDGVDEPFIFERGADAFLARQKPWAVELARELGLNDQILPTGKSGGVYTVRDGALLRLPAGLRLIVPTDRAAFLASPIMSEAGKRRVLDEPNVPPRINGARDESVADFVARRLGREALERLAEPFLSGIYSADSTRQSLAATFPRYLEAERKHGSLLNAPAPQVAPPRDGLTPFVSFIGGTETLIRTLADALTGDLRLNARVDAIERAADGFRVRLAGGDALDASRVIATTPASISASLLASVASGAVEPLCTLRTVSTGAVLVALRRDDVPHPLDGFGAVVPQVEGRDINALTWMTSKFAGRAPTGYVIIRAFFGGARTPHMLDRSDDEVLTDVRRELRALLGVEAAPVLQRIYRWIDAQPQYDVGHLDRVAAIEAALPAGVRVAGSAFRGVGIPDCVRQGREAAEKIIKSKIED